MPFSDDDLNQLKEDVDVGGEIGTSRLAPLLHRLEAAEKLAATFCEIK